MTKGSIKRKHTGIILFAKSSPRLVRYLETAGIEFRSKDNQLVILTEEAGTATIERLLDRLAIEVAGMHAAAGPTPMTADLGLLVSADMAATSIRLPSASMERLGALNVELVLSIYLSSD